MFIAFNAILIALVLLIAYWWMNQGVFSAVLHFACVVVAGAIAFAVWEPMAMMMLKRDILTNSAWGIGLLGPFCVALFLTRLASDKLVPDNLNFPQWVNFSFGAVFGVASGVLTMGMCLIGGGFIQSSRDVMGFAGAVRTVESRGAPNFDNQRLWVPMHSITESFYAWLSAGALAPEMGTPLRDAYPGLADVAFGLYRDSYRDGKARTSITPKAITMKRLFYSGNLEVDGPAMASWVVEMEIGMEATDSGGVLSVSAAQIRLIENVPTGQDRAPRTAHPFAFSQPSDVGTGMTLALFDDVTAYASNVPGQQLTRLFFAFPATNLGNMSDPPEYLQIKGLRVRLPQPEGNTEYDGRDLALIMRGVDASVAGNPVLTNPDQKMIRPKDLTSDLTITPANGAVGELGNIEHVDNYLTFGKENFQKGGKPASKANRVKGIYAPEGTAVLRLNISRGDSSIDVWNSRSDYRKEAGEQAALMLVDSEGATYLPTGYLWVNNDSVEVRLEKAGLATIGDFPPQSSSGGHELYAIYRVTVGRKIVSVRLGNIVLANAEFEVTTQSKR